MSADAAAVDPASLITWSLSGALACRFPASRSQAYPSALAVAKSAQHYAETGQGKALLHWCGFGRTRDQLARALSVVHATYTIKGFELYAGGQLLAECHKAMHVLRCALQAEASEDPRAHCVVMMPPRFVGLPGKRHLPDARLLSFAPAPTLEQLMTNPHADSEDPPYPFPCRYMADRQFKFQASHPSSLADQLRAGAVRAGCDWCPNFSNV